MVLPLIAALALTAPSAPAEGVTWIAPGECPSAQEVRGQIAARLPAGAVEPRADLQVTGNAKDGYRLVLRVSVEDTTHERELVGNDCRGVADAATFLVAAAVTPVQPEDDARSSDGEAEAETEAEAEGEAETEAETEAEAEAEAETEAEAEPGPEPIEPAAAASRPRGEERAAPAIRGLLRLGLGGAALVVPSPTPMLDGSASVAGRRWEASAGAVYLAGLPYDVGGPARLPIHIGAVSLRGCGIAGPARLEVPLCAGMLVGGAQARARGEGVVGAVGRAAWVMTVADVGLRWWVARRIAVSARVGGGLALVRPSFAIEGYGRVWRGGLVGLLGTLGITVRLGGS